MSSWDIDLIKPRAFQMRRLMKHLPVNSYGLPEGFYRVDMLDGDTISIDSEGGEYYAQGAQIQAPSDKDGKDPSRLGATSSNAEKSNREEATGEVAGREEPTEIVIPPEGDTPISAAQHQGSSPSQSLQLALNPRVMMPKEKKRTENAAFVVLSYHDGFPTMPDARPFWAKLQWEPDIAFHLFQCFIQMGSDGSRTVFGVHRQASLNKIVHPWQDSSNPHLGLLYMSEMYCWQERARAFDLFEAIELRKTMARRALRTMDRHYLAAERLFRIAEEHLTNQDREPLTNREAIELIKVASTLERISVGLSAGTGVSAKDGEAGPLGAPNTPIEVMIGNELKRQGVNAINKRGGNLDHLLADPDLARQAQDMVLRLRGHKVPERNGTGTPGVDAEPPPIANVDPQDEESDEAKKEVERLEREIRKDVG